MKKLLLWGALILALLAGLFIGRILPDTRSPGGVEAGPSKNPATAKGEKGGKGKGGRPVPVRVIVAAPGTLGEVITGGGTVIPDEAVELRVEATGRVSRILMEEGASVKKGQLLLTILDDDIAAQLRKAEAVSALAGRKAARVRDLCSREMASTEDGEAADKEEAAARADVDLLTAMHAKTELRAPFDGIVGLRSVSEGAYLTAGTKIADLVRRTQVKIECAVPERAAPAIRPGTPVEIRIPGSGATATAVIYAVQPGLDRSTRTLSFRARMPAAPGLIPGTYVPVSLSLRHSETALMIPAIGVVADALGNKVFIVKNGSAVPRPVVTGLRTEDRIEILSGIAMGDSVITDGAALVRPQGPVTIAREQP